MRIEKIPYRSFAALRVMKPAFITTVLGGMGPPVSVIQ